jgi:hypothetical protein
VVKALAPTCADRFGAQADAPTQIAVLGVPGACAEMLLAPTQPKT